MRIEKFRCVPGPVCVQFLEVGFPRQNQGAFRQRLWPKLSYSAFLVLSLLHRRYVTPPNKHHDRRAEIGEG